jgi:RNA-directed DNA polymerase
VKQPVLSVRKLASMIGVAPARLSEIEQEIAADFASHYIVFSRIDPIKLKSRTFRNPRPELKFIQRRILRNVLAQIVIHEMAHGGIRGRSPSSNASLHLGAQCIVTVDIRDFFPSVRHYAVYRMFREELGFGRDVARILTRLTTVDSQLPQGAPTSTAIANLLLSLAVDENVSLTATKLALIPSRFVDDFAVSGCHPEAIINVIAQSLSKKRLRIWRKRTKLKIMHRSQRQQVSGLLVNDPCRLSVSRPKRDGVKAAIFQLPLVEAGARAKAISSIRGRINYIRQFNPGSAARLDKYLSMRLQ